MLRAIDMPFDKIRPSEGTLGNLFLYLSVSASCNLREGLQSSPHLLDHPHMNCLVASAAGDPRQFLAIKVSFG
jgi:hypothetical protein